MINPVKIGVLSTARIAREKVIPGFRTTPWVDTVAIASRDPARAKSVAEALGIPKAFGSYDELLADPDIEAVYIPTPNDSHVDLSLAAAKAGKHVLCEKPSALNQADAERLRAIPPGIVYSEAFMVRHHPQWIAAREMVRAGRIGTPVGLQTWFSYTLHDPENIRNKPENGGGAALDIGCYAIVTARYILGREPTRLVASVDYDPAFKTDRLTSGLVEFGPECHLTFSVGTQTVPYQRVNIVGTKGRIEAMIPFNAPQGAPTVIRIDDGKLLGDVGMENVVIPACDQYGLEGEIFAKVIRGELPATYGVEDAIQMMKILDALFQSAHEKRWIEF
jgi:predicted dehydrogenase